MCGLKPRSGDLELRSDTNGLASHYTFQRDYKTQRALRESAHIKWLCCCIYIMHTLSRQEGLVPHAALLVGNKKVHMILAYKRRRTYSYRYRDFAKKNCLVCAIGLYDRLFYNDLLDRLPFL